MSEPQVIGLEVQVDGDGVFAAAQVATQRAADAMAQGEIEAAFQGAQVGEVGMQGLAQGLVRGSVLEVEGAGDGPPQGWWSRS